MRLNMLRILSILVLAGCAGNDPPVPRQVLLVPIGPVPADVLAQLQRELPPVVKRDVVVGAGIQRPPQAFDASRQQYRGSALLAELKRHRFEGADRVVGIIDADTYAPGLNFIFGQADKPGRFAIVALPRLRQSFRGQPEDPVLFRQRAVKETVHELGHTFGFGHCDNRRCVMAFSNSLGDTDYKGAAFCGREEVPD